MTQQHTTNGYTVIAMIIGMMMAPLSFASSETAAKRTQAIQEGKQQLVPQASPINGSSVFDGGVFSVGAYDDDSMGIETTFASYLGSSQRHAAALEFDGGSKLFRVNATYGLALTDNQRLKLTFERLSEKLDFGFDTGNKTRWMSQNALGAEYAYLFDNDYLESMGLGGYVTHSASKKLSDAKLYDAAGRSYTEHRRIAGATSMNVHTDTALRLWPQSRLSGGVDYDSVRFDTKYEGHKQDVHGFGGHARLEQRILPQVKLAAGTHYGAVEHRYDTAVGWLLPTSTPIELEASMGHVKNMSTKRRFYTRGLRLNVGLGNAGASGKHVYTDLDKGNRRSLLGWVRIPAVRMSQVLAIKDSKLVEDPSQFESSAALTEFEQQLHDEGLRYIACVEQGNNKESCLDEFSKEVDNDLNELPESALDNATCNDAYAIARNLSQSNGKSIGENLEYVAKYHKQFNACNIR